MEQDVKSKAKKWVGLAVLTYVMYALPTFFQTGDFVFPTPINELVLVCVGSAWWFSFRGTYSPYTGILLGFFATRALLNPYYWNFFLPIDQIEQWQSSSWLPILGWIPAIVFTFFVALEFQKKAHIVYFTSVGLIAVLTLIGILFGLQWIYLLQFGIVILTLLRDRFRFSLHAETFYSTPYLLLLAFLLEAFAFLNHL